MRAFPRIFVLFILLSAIVAGCASAQVTPLSTAAVTPAAPIPSQTVAAMPAQAEVAPTAAPPQAEVTPTAPATPAENQPLSQYTLNVDLNYNQRSAQVDEQIVYQNRTGAELPDLVLMVEPTGYPNTFSLNEITWDGGAPVEGTTWDVNRLRVPLAQPLQPGESAALRIKYALSLPTPVISDTVRPIPFGATDKQTNLVDWYPFIPAYQVGVGWLAHEPGFYGEHLAYEMADFSVNLRLVEEPGNLVVAAPAPVTQDGEWQRFHLAPARTFALSVSPYYQVQTQQVGEVMVSSYFFAAHAAAGERVLQTTAEALGIFDAAFAPYPHPSLSVVEADFLDGMEYDGLYFLSYGFYNLYSGTPGEYLVAIAAHETAHQWWFGLVGNDQALEPWLDEALATYSEEIYYEKTYPDALDWWWNYRVRYYEPRGWVDTSIYNPYKSAQPYRDYRDAVYLNGAEFLNELRQTIGDEAFFAFIHDYAASYQGQLVHRADFFTALTRHTSLDLTALVQEYFSQ